MTTATLARCTEAGCPQRWRTGPDRDCGSHTSSEPDVFAAAAELGIDLTPAGKRDASNFRSDGRHEPGHASRS